MAIIIKNNITIEHSVSTNFMFNTIKKDLTIANPSWVNASRMSLPMWGIQKDLKYYTEEDGNLIVPAGYLDNLVRLLPNEPVVDQRISTGLPLEVEFKGTLRDYQEAAVNVMLSKVQGVLSAPTGAGKTICLIALICRRRLPTLITVNTIELGNQFIDSLVKFTDLQKEDIGFIGDGRYEVKPITVALLQTLTKLDPADIDMFPQVISDEVHVCAASTFYAALTRLSAKYKVGCSATPAREDGLTSVIFWATGPLRHEIDLSNLGNVLLKPTYRQVLTNYFYPLVSSDEYQLMLNHMAEDPVRNKQISDEVAKYGTQQCLLLCQRHLQVDALMALIPGSVGMTSKMTKKKRAATMAALLTGQHRIVISTFALFSTGIDIPNLEILFIAAPIKSKNKIKQSIGRIMRKGSITKVPEVIDFVDSKVGLLKFQATTRKRIIGS